MRLVEGPFRRFAGALALRGARAATPAASSSRCDTSSPAACSAQAARAAVRRHRRLDGRRLRAPRRRRCMKVEVVYALPGAARRGERRAAGRRHRARRARRLGLLERIRNPLEKQAFGIFGKRVALETPARGRRPGRDLPAARDRSEGSAPAARRAASAERLAAALLDASGARARSFLRDLRVVEVVALALGVGARDALAALQRAQRLLRARAVLALGRGFLLGLRLPSRAPSARLPGACGSAASGLSALSVSPFLAAAAARGAGARRAAA